MANTQFTYLYRDAGNWKQFETIILEGEMSAKDIDMIMSKLESDGFFLPEQVGLPRLQNRWEVPNNDDHIWHELSRGDIEIVDLPATTTMTSANLVARFRRVKTWNVKRALKLLE